MIYNNFVSKIKEKQKKLINQNEKRIVSKIIYEADKNNDLQINTKYWFNLLRNNKTKND